MEMGPIQQTDNHDSGQGYTNKACKEDQSSLGDINVAVDTPAEASASSTAPSAAYLNCLPKGAVYISESMQEEENPNACTKCIIEANDSLNNIFTTHKKVLWRVFYCVLVLLYFAYFIYAMYYSFGDEGSARLLWMTCLVLFGICWHFASKFLGGKVGGVLEHIVKKSELISWVVVSIIWVAVIIYIIVDVAAISKNPYNLVSLAGIFIYILLNSDAPLLIRPLIQNMTRSELHAVMTGGFATIAGGVFSAYISFGVPANHLLSASVMSAPAALAMAKLFYPETERSKTTFKDVQKMEKSDARNIVEAASTGASASISLVASIGVNLIAFLAMLAFCNATLEWFGARIGLLPPDIVFDFEFIASYILWPFALIMGVETIDCGQVARLIGLKTFLNEFIAYGALGTLVKNRDVFYDHLALNGTYSYSGNNIRLHPANSTEIIVSTLKGGILHAERSLVISTYALCGFANFGSVGIMIASLSTMAPHRRGDLSQVAVRAMIAGNVACFMTACIAGVFYDGNIR